MSEHKPKLVKYIFHGYYPVQDHPLVLQLYQYLELHLVPILVRSHLVDIDYLLLFFPRTFLVAENAKVLVSFENCVLNLIIG